MFRHQGDLVMPETISPRFFVETVGGVNVVTLADTEIIDETVIGELGEQFNLIDGPGLSRVLINLGQVRLMSSTFLAILLRFSRRVAAVEGRLKICCIAPDLMTVFKITRFDRIFEIHDEESAALDSF
jgi:anti-sigma B factor antagonist